MTISAKLLRGGLLIGFVSGCFFIAIRRESGYPSALISEPKQESACLFYLRPPLRSARISFKWSEQVKGPPYKSNPTE